MAVRRTAYLEAIRERLRNNPIVSLVGPRQAGKTTLARMLAEESAEAVHFFDLESPADLARLAGRVSFIDVTGFSLAELGADTLSRLWWRGGFPRAFLAADDAATRQWLEDFRRTFLERDIPQLGLQVPAATLGRFWTMVAHYHGQVLNVAELARALGSSEPTARRYLDILSGTYVVRQLPPWFENLKKRQVRSPKVYVRDPGLVCSTRSSVSPTRRACSRTLNWGLPGKGSAWNRSSACAAIGQHVSGGRTAAPSSTCCCRTQAADSASSSSSPTVPRPPARCEWPCKTWRSTISSSSTPASMSSRWTNRSPPSRCRA